MLRKVTFVLLALVLMLAVAAPVVINDASPAISADDSYSIAQISDFSDFYTPSNDEDPNCTPPITCG